MTVRPLNSHVLVKPRASEEKTPGGVYLPDTAREDQKEGQVIAVAEDATEEIAVGDRVIYKEFSGAKVSVEGEDHVLLSSEDLLAKYVAVDKIPD